MAVLLTVLLGTVCPLGVFNTVVLNNRERRRDLGVLKAMGMLPVLGAYFPARSAARSRIAHVLQTE